MLASTEAGLNAQTMMNARGYKTLEVGGIMTLRAMLPSASSEEEPTWLANCRGIPRGTMYRPEEYDMIALSAIPHFEFGLFAFNLLFHGDSSVGNMFEIHDDMMIALEGLCWE